MQKKEHKIGETFHCGIIHLKCVKAKRFCEGCYFYDQELNCPKDVGDCSALKRKDGIGVIFVKVEDLL